jgi:hypothetical protein
MHRLCRDRQSDIGCRRLSGPLRGPVAGRSGFGAPATDRCTCPVTAALSHRFAPHCRVTAWSCSGTRPRRTPRSTSGLSRCLRMIAVGSAGTIAGAGEAATENSERAAGYTAAGISAGARHMLQSSRLHGKRGGVENLWAATWLVFVPHVDAVARSGSTGGGIKMIRTQASC